MVIKHYLQLILTSSCCLHFFIWEIKHLHLDDKIFAADSHLIHLHGDDIDFVDDDDDDGDGDDDGGDDGDPHLFRLYAFLHLLQKVCSGQSNH